MSETRASHVRPRPWSGPCRAYSARRGEQIEAPSIHNRLSSQLTVGTETFSSPLGWQSRVLIQCPSRVPFSRQRNACCAAALPSAPGREHAPHPPARSRPGPTAIGQGVGENEGHRIKSWLMPLSVASRQMTNLEHGTAPYVRFRIEGAMHHAR